MFDLLELLVMMSLVGMGCKTGQADVCSLFHIHVHNRRK